MIVTSVSCCTNQLIKLMTDRLTKSDEVVVVVVVVGVDTDLPSQRRRATHKQQLLQKKHINNTYIGRQNKSKKN